MQLRQLLITATLLTAIGNAQSAAPVLDELYVTKIELLQTRAQLLNSEEQLLNASKAKQQEEVQKLVMEVEAKYPGFTLSMQNGQLVPKQQVPQVQMNPQTKQPELKK